MDIANKTVKVKTIEMLLKENNIKSIEKANTKQNLLITHLESNLPKDRIIKLDSNQEWQGLRFKSNVIEQIIDESMTKEDLEKRLEEFKAELVAEHFPEVKEGGKCIELLKCISEKGISLFKYMECEFQSNIDNFLLLRGKDEYYKCDIIEITATDNEKFVCTANWNSGIDKQGRDWNK